MRLIDADALIDYIESDNSNLMSAREYQSDYIECIEEMPVAYDVEKVVEKIKKCAGCVTCRHPDECGSCFIGEIISIVKDGG